MILKNLGVSLKKTTFLFYNLRIKLRGAGEGIKRPSCVTHAGIDAQQTLVKVNQGRSTFTLHNLSPVHHNVR